MMLFFESVPVLATLMGGLLAFHTADAKRARRVAVTAGAVSVASATLGLILLVVWGLRGDGGTPDIGSFSPLVPVVVAVIGLAAAAMNPVRSGAKTFGRILLINAATAWLVLVPDPIVLAVLWTLEIATAWQELHSRPCTRPASRVFALYLVPSAVAALAAAALHTAGNMTAAFVLLSVAIAIRAALVPTHSWLLDFVEHAPMGIVVSFVSPQVGLYVFLRLVGENIPDGVTNIVAGLGVTTALFAGSLGVVQTRARRALGYVLISQTALVAFGLGMHSHLGHVATAGAWIAIGLATAGFASVLGALEARRGPLSLHRPTGSYERTPLLAAAFLVLGLASVGLPGTFGFVAEDLLFEAAIGEYPWLTASLIVSTALNGVTVLRCFFLLFMGRRDHSGERDLGAREWVALTLLVGALVIEGLWPSFGFAPSSSAAETHTAFHEASKGNR